MTKEALNKHASLIALSGNKNVKGVKVTKYTMSITPGWFKVERISRGTAREVYGVGK